MPRWPDEFTDSTIFLYPTKEDAGVGARVGGSGFLVGVPWESNPNDFHIYAVSNVHVVKGGGASVIRLNTKNGKTDFFEADPSEWMHRPGHDVAVYHMGGARGFQENSIWDYKFENFLKFRLTDEIWRKFQLGIGDEIASPGRFMDLSSVQRNQPILRTGILACGRLVTVGQSIDMQRSYWAQESSYICEMRSRTGFSGSPVYIYIDPFSPRMVDLGDKTHQELMRRRFGGPWLLGVHWGQLPITGPDGADEKDAASSAVITVVPCSALSALLLEDERVIEQRREYEEASQRGVHAVAESAPPTTDENPQHREDFNRLLDAAVPGNKSDR